MFDSRTESAGQARGGRRRGNACRRAESAAARVATAHLRLSQHACDELAERIGRAADAVQGMGTEVAKTSISAGAVVDGVGADVRRFSAETLPQVEHLAGELSSLSGSLRLLTEQTRRDPKGLIFGPTPVPDGPGESGGKP